MHRETGVANDVTKLKYVIFHESAPVWMPAKNAKSRKKYWHIGMMSNQVGVSQPFVDSTLFLRFLAFFAATPNPLRRATCMAQFTSGPVHVVGLEL
jgi:hypothetical protein